MSFAHLHAHAEFSQLDGCGRSVDMVARAAELGMPALALTDHGNMSGVLHHIEACGGLRDGERVHEPIKAIAGIEAYFREDIEKDREDRATGNSRHLLLLARNDAGWRNLLALTSRSYNLENFYQKPCLSWELLKKHSEGIVASTGCLSSLVPYALQTEDEKEARRLFEKMIDVWGDDLVVEIQPHDIDEQRLVNPTLVDWANEKGLMLIATADVHYPTREWSETHDVLLMCNTGQTMRTREKAAELGEDYLKFSGDTFFLQTKQEMAHSFQAFHSMLDADACMEAIANTVKLADRFEVMQIDKSLKAPRVKGAKKIVRNWAEEGLLRVNKAFDPVYRERLDHEMKVLEDKEALDYFAVIGDAVRWAKGLLEDKPAGRPIRVGAGRGSAAGSLVAYLTRITALDPIGHGLLFERFLNEHRAEQPDVDIDFQHNRRKEVIAHVADVHGKENVVGICSHMTFGVRSALQVVAKIFDVPLEEVMEVTRTMEDGGGDLGLEDIRQVNVKLDEFAKNYPDVWLHANRIEGQVRTNSKHAAGVVVTDKPVYEYMPTMADRDGNVITQWSEQAEFPIITKYGFLKIDFLGIDDLTRQDQACELIEQRHGIVIDFEDPVAHPVIVDPDAGEDDVIRSFGEGLNLGVFQFEGRGISALLKEIKPDSFRDLVAANALFRPGPLDSGTARSYGLRKNGHEDYRLADWGPAAPFVEETHGIMVYQEQAILVAAALAGWGPARADEVRRAITKLSSAKIDSNLGALQLQREEEEFVDDTKKNLGDAAEAFARNVWAQIVFFTRYSFNKSHSAGYSKESYNGMWLKRRYPLEFYAPLLTGETEKVPQTIREAHALDMKILPPDVNVSGAGFTLSGNAIRFGLMPVAYVGDSAIAEIEAKRPFTSYDDFVERVQLRKCNSRARENLVNCGAFDELGMRAGWSDEQKAAFESVLLGTSLTSSQSLMAHRAVLDERIHTTDEFELLDDGANAVIGGEVLEVKEINTKKGEKMAFVDIAYGKNAYSATFFPRTYGAFSHLLRKGNAMLITGEKDGQRGTVMVEQAIGLQQLLKSLENGGK